MEIVCHKWERHNRKEKGDDWKWYDRGGANIQSAGDVNTKIQDIISGIYNL